MDPTTKISDSQFFTCFYRPVKGNGRFTQYPVSKCQVKIIEDFRPDYVMATVISDRVESLYKIEIHEKKSNVLTLTVTDQKINVNEQIRCRVLIESDNRPVSFSCIVRYY